MNALPDSAAATAETPSAANGRGRAMSPRMFVFIGFVIALTAIFGRELWSLFRDALDSELNSYIILIPFVSLYFLHLERERLPRQYRSSFGAATAPLLIGLAALALLVTGVVRPQSSNDRTALVVFSFLCFLWAGGFAILGREWMTRTAFPMFFLIFVVPLPDAAVDWLENALRITSAEAAGMFFTLTGTPAFKTGTIFQLPGITIEVAKECSGIRSSWVLFITSVVAAQLFLTKPWSRILLVLAVVPLGILRNGFRIMVIGLLCVRVDPDMIHSVIHRRGGPIFFVLSLGPLLLILWWLRRREIARDVGVHPMAAGTPG